MNKQIGSPSGPCRILMIDDDPVRVEQIRDWLTEDVRLVVASSAGRAMGTLRMDPPETYAGIMLDHDLQMSIAHSAEAALSGSDLVSVIVRHVDLEALMLVHSANTSRAPVMATRLREAGFETRYIPFHRLTRPTFDAWVADVQDNWRARVA